MVENENVAVTKDSPVTHDERSETAKSQAQTTKRAIEQAYLPHKLLASAGLGYETWERQAKDRNKEGGLRRVGAWMGLVKQKSKIPDTAIFKADLEEVRRGQKMSEDVMKENNLDSEPKADTNGLQASIDQTVIEMRRRIDAATVRGEGLDHLKTSRDLRHLRPLEENEVIEWDGLRRQKTRH